MNRFKDEIGASSKGPPLKSWNMRAWAGKAKVSDVEKALANALKLTPCERVKKIGRGQEAVWMQIEAVDMKAALNIAEELSEKAELKLDWRAV